MNMLQWPLECLMGNAFELFEYLSHLPNYVSFVYSYLSLHIKLHHNQDGFKKNPTTLHG